MNNHNILVVEDDTQIRNFICFTLKQEGFNPLSATTGKGALSLLVQEAVDLILLDLGLPYMDGTEVIRHVREWSEIPILVISARDQIKEKAEVLDLGADDYLTKPFSAVELMARIRVALRHLNKNSQLKEQSTLKVGELSIDFIKRCVVLDEKSIHLTPLEYSLLALLFKNLGKVMTTGAILKELYGANYGSDTQALRALMAGLRRKIESNPAQPRYIFTEVGVGYRLSDE